MLKPSGLCLSQHVSPCEPKVLSGLVESPKEGNDAGCGEGGEEGLLGQGTLKHFGLALPVLPGLYLFGLLQT